MSSLTSGPAELCYTAGKAALMYATALTGLRLSERRTLAQWSTIDFVAAVAVGAVVGRTAIASTQSFAAGAVALVVLLALHALSASPDSTAGLLRSSTIESDSSFVTGGCANANCTGAA